MSLNPPFPAFHIPWFKVRSVHDQSILWCFHSSKHSIITYCWQASLFNIKYLLCLFSVSSVVFYRVSTALGYRAGRYNGDILESYPLNIDNGKHKSTHTYLYPNYCSYVSMCTCSHILASNYCLFPTGNSISETRDINDNR